MVRTIKGGQHLPSTRNAKDFYAVSLGNDQYKLTSEVLEKNVDVKTLKTRDWLGPTLKFASFKGGKLELFNTYEKTTYKLAIKVEKDKLHVSCSCGTEVEKLCLHAYRALVKLLFWGSKNYFEAYRPNGLVEIGLANKRHFKLNYGENGLMVQPEKELGSVYLLEEENNSNKLEDLLHLPGIDEAEPTPTSFAVCYMLMLPRRDNRIPFLMPCIGRVNKPGTGIKGFVRFIQEGDKELEHLLTPDQRYLNNLCWQFWKLIEGREKLHQSEGELKSSFADLTPFLNLWKKALPLLKAEATFTTTYFRPRQFKDRPSKSWTEEVLVSVDIPSLVFQLADRGSFYQLTLKASVKDKVLNGASFEGGFFAENSKTIYLLRSLRDIAVVEWMRRNDNCITVFKQFFSEFMHDYIQPLQAHYTFQNTRTTKKA